MTVTLDAPLKVAKLRDDAVLPTRAHPGDAGLDLVAAESVELAPGGGRCVVGTGLAVEIPEGWAGLVCPRSGIAARHGIGLVNAPGVIDAGYRGELRVPLINTDPSEPFAIRAGDRIAQLLLVPVSLVGVEEVDALSSAERNADGFGSTGGFGGEH